MYNINKNKYIILYFPYYSLFDKACKMSNAFSAVFLRGVAFRAVELVCSYLF